jgi:hypothetical protein
MGVSSDRQAKGTCQSKIRQLKLLNRGVEQDVLWLQISVENPAQGQRSKPSLLVGGAGSHWVLWLSRQSLAVFFAQKLLGSPAVV